MVPSGTARLSVVVPTLGRAPVLRRVLDRLGLQSAPPAEFEAIVVSDAAEREPEAIRALVEDRPFPARHLIAPAPGASAARNAGLRAASAGVVLFLDDDVLPGQALVAEHLDWHAREPAPEVAVLGHVRWADELRITPLMRWLDRGMQFDYGGIDGIEAGWGRLYTANVSLKRALVERAGGFAERELPFGYEDLDLAIRLDRLGLRLLYNPAAEAEHLHPMDLDFWRRRVRRIAAAERRFTERHPEVAPHFLESFRSAAAAPTAGPAWRLAPVVPPGFPLLGPRVWRSVDMHYRQELAPHFLAAWEEGDAAGATTPAPDRSGGPPP